MAGSRKPARLGADQFARSDTPTASEVSGAEKAPVSILDERDRLAVETLYKEFQRIQAKSSATDDWFFRFLSIAVVPFLVFLAASLNPQYRIFIAALPVLSMIGALVVVVLTSHYLYVGSYGEYLQRQINERLGSEVIRDTRYARAAYAGLSPVVVS